MMNYYPLFLRRTDRRSADGHRLAWFKCFCGAEFLAISSRVKNGYLKSCGCRMRTAALKHGGRYTRTYRVWISMHRRCLAPTDKDYPKYGGRGITICERWNDYANFIADMGERPTWATSIDRINSKGNYEPSNCRWATAKIQNRNKSDTVYLRTPVGVMHISDYAIALGITADAARKRLKRGKLTGCQRVLQG